ncbi:MAG: hypothetical protein FJ304_11530 [Planctomycetes bacterium]|nr:hypothetical protein [Planctomycetota bacterium]
MRRVFAALGLVLALGGVVLFAGAVMGVWWVRAETNRRTEALAVKARAAVGAADHAVAFVREVIARGDTELAEARKHAAAEPQQYVNPLLQLSARRASENLAGSVERANAAVLTASDAAVVAEAALELFGDDAQFPELKTWLGVKPDQLQQTRTDLGSASRELKNVRTMLGIPVAMGERPSAEQLMTVEAALGQAREFTDRMGRVVSAARERVEETKRLVDRWVLRIAIGTTLIGLLAATGQLFMARTCWRALRAAP